MLLRDQSPYKYQYITFTSQRERDFPTDLITDSRMIDGGSAEKISLCEDRLYPSTYADSNTALEHYYRGQQQGLQQALSLLPAD